MTWDISTSCGREADKTLGLYASLCYDSGMETRSVTVYGLSSTEDGIVRYIGQTAGPLIKRLHRHRSEAKRNPNRRLSRWLHSVGGCGHQVQAIVLVDDAIWNQTECTVIAHYRSCGADLVNGTEGGDGALGRVFAHTPESRAKTSLALIGKPRNLSDAERERRAASARAMAPLSRTPEALAKMAATNRGRRPTNLDAIHANLVGRPKSEVTRARISATLAGRTATAGAKANQSAAIKKFLADNPASLEKRRATLAVIHQQRRDARDAKVSL